MFRVNPCRTDRDTSNSFEGIKNSQKWKIFVRAFGTVISCNRSLTICSLGGAIAPYIHPPFGVEPKQDHEQN
jgi:hypothetical protein